MKLKNKIAIITGGGQGIGEAIATALAQEGATPVIADINLANAQTVATQLNGHAIKLDVTDPENVTAMVIETIDKYGHIDTLVNNAGIGQNRPFLDTPLDEWNQILNVNLTGPFLCGQAVAREMIKQKSGKIINIGSISGQLGAQGRSAYGVSKAGIIQLTRIMAVELAPHGIYVNAISPGPVDTEQSRAMHTQSTRQSYLNRIPLGRYGSREEVAAAAVFLASDDSNFVVGHVLNTDGGFKMAGLTFEPDVE
ncbi:MAG: SDR family oxidoreductase [Candidatus Latescibacteria bacterium]|jgi:NAD(P)-dependent dehydrogenase (short-subunit alcohol dehydrogenase family)|nr:SDR family oxidoreductase [Candidatus Latescibacterota bacterium]